MIAVDAAHWPQPFGWTYLNVFGNVVASVVWAGPPFLAGAVYGKRRAAKTDAHSHWMATHMARVHAVAVGPPDEHPQHGSLT